MKLLTCVGGILDGRHIPGSYQPLIGHQQISVWSQHIPECSLVANLPAVEQNVEIHRYQLHIVGCDHLGAVQVYALQGMPVNEVIETLRRRYD